MSTNQESEILKEIISSIKLLAKSTISKFGSIAESLDENNESSLHEVLDDIKTWLKDVEDKFTYAEKSYKEYSQKDSSKSSEVNEESEAGSSAVGLCSKTSTSEIPVEKEISGSTVGFVLLSE